MTTIPQTTQNKIRQLFRKHNLPIPGAPKTNARYQYHFYKPLHNNDFQYLNRFKHWVAYNLEGPRYFLYLTSDETGQLQAWYLENEIPSANQSNQSGSLNAKLGSHRLNPEVYKETLIEGQIINGSFVISDLLVYKGQAMLTNHSLTYRLSYLDSFIKNHWQSDPVIDSYQFEVKSYVELDYLKDFWELRNKGCSYSNQINGLVFRPNARNFKNYTVYLTQPHCYILSNETEIGAVMTNLTTTSSMTNSKKPDPTIDLADTVKTFFTVHDTNINKPDVYYLYDINQPKEKRKIATITSLENSLKLQKIFQETTLIENSQGHKGLYFQCEYQPRFRRWELIKLSEFSEITN